ncbi:MAG: alanine racemase [Thermoanaerobaculia bacterium]
MDAQRSTLNAQLPVRAVVDLDAIASNYRFLANRVAPRRVYAVVKADAYGHGAVPAAARLARAGADRFAVANPEEGAALRRGGIAGEILVLSRVDPEDVPRLGAYGLTPALYDAAQAEGIAAAARALSGAVPLPVHLELDTGMGRAGFRAEELDFVISLFQHAPALRLAGTFANLSRADDPSSPETARQVERLRAAASRLREAGLAPGLVHAANSAAILGAEPGWLDAVRPGLALYGIAPRGFPEAAALRPAMTVEARVTAVRRVPADTPLGYGGRFVTERPTTIAVLPIGYHDGFRRSFSGRVSVLLGGKRAPVVGAVSMDVTLVDTTDAPVRRGDRAVCLGPDGADAVTAWELADAAGTIPYEILCGIGPRVPRVHVESGGDPTEPRG